MESCRSEKLQFDKRPMKTPPTFFLLSLLLLCTTPLSGQESKQPPKEPQTKLGAFEAQTGSVIVRGFATIGNIRAKYSTTVTVDAREFSDAASGRKEYGISIEINEKGTLERRSTSYVDFEEIDSLVKGIEYIAKVDKASTKLEHFEADYRTRGDLRVGTFSDSSGKIEAVIVSGYAGRVTAYMPLSELKNFKDLITRAKQRLDSIRSEAK